MFLHFIAGYYGNEHLMALDQLTDMSYNSLFTKNHNNLWENQGYLLIKTRQISREVSYVVHIFWYLSMENFKYFQTFFHNKRGTSVNMYSCYITSIVLFVFFLQVHFWFPMLIFVWVSIFFSDLCFRQFAKFAPITIWKSACSLWPNGDIIHKQRCPARGESRVMYITYT